MKKILRLLNKDTLQLLEVHYNTPNIYPAREVYVVDDNVFRELEQLVINAIPEIDQKSNN